MLAVSALPNHGLLPPRRIITVTYRGAPVKLHVTSLGNELELGLATASSLWLSSWAASNKFLSRRSWCQRTGPRSTWAPAFAPNLLRGFQVVREVASKCLMPVLLGGQAVIMQQLRAQDDLLLRLEPDLVHRARVPPPDDGGKRRAPLEGGAAPLGASQQRGAAPKLRGGVGGSDHFAGHHPSKETEHNQINHVEYQKHDTHNIFCAIPWSQ